MFRFVKGIACIFTALTSNAYAVTFTVDTTSDVAITACSAAASDCSLRGAMIRADADAVLDTIAFNIPPGEAGCDASSGVCRISLLSSGEANLQPLVIDGYTQPGAAANTIAANVGGSNAQLRIELFGGSCGASCPGVRMGNSLTVRGLIINGFAQAGINVGDFFFSLAGSNSVIEGNFIGTNFDGTSATSNFRGINVNGGSNRAINVRIGGNSPAARNVISGNRDDGIASGGNTVQILGNLIGSNAAGTQPLANGANGILVVGCGFAEGQNHSIGSADSQARNLISGNTGHGVRITHGNCADPQGNSVRGNYIGTDITGLLPMPNGNANSPANVAVEVIFGLTSVQNSVGGIAPGEGNLIANAISGVRLSSAGGQIARGNRIRNHAQLGLTNNSSGLQDRRRPNDTSDADALTNGAAGRLQNFPDVTGFSVNAGNASISYRVDSAIANSIYPLQVDFYKAEGDEGSEYLGSDTYTAAQAQTIKAVSLALPNSITLTAQDVIIASAVDNEANQSEFSFYPLTLQIETPVPSACGGNVRIFCDAFESDPQRSIEVTVRGTSPLFKPNGNVRLSDNRGASCMLTLVPTVTALTSSGRCVLANSGAPGAIIITAEYDTFNGAFGDGVTGGNVTQSSNFTIPAN